MDENLRKITHIVFGVVISVAILLLERNLLLKILSVSILAGYSLSDAIGRGYRVPIVSPLIERLERKGEMPAKGALFFVLSALVCMLLFDRTLVFSAMITLAILDGFAALIGRNFGKKIIMKGKTLEGSLTGSVAALIVLLLFLGPVEAFIITFAAGLVELLSPVDDNLTIPITVCIVLSLIRMTAL